MSAAGSVVSAEIPLNTAGKSKGHALVTYDSVASALKAVQTLNDVELDGRKVILRQNKPKAPVAAAAAPAGRPAAAPSSASVYVGNVAFSGEDSTCALLVQLAPRRCPPALPSARAVTAEALTSHLNTVGKVVSVSLSRGWALARYSSPKGAAAAIARLTDTEIDGRKIFVREDREAPSAGAGAPPRAKVAASAGTVTVVKPVAGPAVAVSGLPHDITAEELRGIFASVGATQATLAGKGSGVVGFRAPASANRAAAEFNGALVNGRTITVRVK